MKERVSEHQGVSRRTGKHLEQTYSTSVRDHILVCNYLVAWDDYQVWGGGVIIAFWRLRRVYLLGDSWNYTPAILLLSSVKRITTQILVIAKSNGRKYLVFLRGFVMSSVPTRNYCENCSKLRMKALEQCQWRRSSVFIVNYEHISNFLLIINFEQTKVCCAGFISKR